MGGLAPGSLARARLTRKCADELGRMPRRRGNLNQADGSEHSCSGQIQEWRGAWEVPFAAKFGGSHLTARVCVLTVNFSEKILQLHLTNIFLAWVGPVYCEFCPRRPGKV